MIPERRSANILRPFTEACRARLLLADIGAKLAEKGGRRRKDPTKTVEDQSLEMVRDLGREGAK
jgi:hypothetical protein